MMSPPWSSSRHRAGRGARPWGRSAAYFKIDLCTKTITRAHKQQPYCFVAPTPTMLNVFDGAVAPAESSAELWAPGKRKRRSLRLEQVFRLGQGVAIDHPRLGDAARPRRTRTYRRSL